MGELVASIGLVVGYLLGSIPFGVILTRLAGAPDVRSIGSGNIGATNVLRSGHKGLAAATLLGDMLKGTLAVVLARRFGGDAAALAAGAGAFIGHLFPVWLKFQGGKGVATYIGVLLGLAWPVALGFCVIWLVVAVVSRYASAASLAAAALVPIVPWLMAQPWLAALCLCLSVLLWIKHAANIARLIGGTETKIGVKAKA